MSLEGTAKTEYASLSGKIHTIVIDKTLSVSGACADAKATGEAINGAEARLANTVEATTEKYLGEKVAPAVEAEVASKAVKKSGDTMTGNFSIKTEKYPSCVLASATHGTDCTLLNDGNIFRYWIRNKTGDSSNGRELRLFSSTYTAGLEEAVALFDMKDGVGKHHPILHTGNIEALGVSRIATGTYTGGGKLGSSAPNSLTFSFAPKLLIVSGGDNTMIVHANGKKGAFIGIDFCSDLSGTLANNIAIKFTEWGTTVKWYSGMAGGQEFQFDQSGMEYAYLAIG